VSANGAYFLKSDCASADVVTTRCEPGESKGDAKIRFLLVILRRELLRDNEMRPMSDWGQVVAGSNPVSAP
jgi:hypothetical protein